MKCENSTIGGQQATAKGDGRNKDLLVLLACLFVVMIGFGITLPVLPFYVERLALVEGATRQSVVIHVGLLTGVYALMQLIFAPLWGTLVGSHRQKTAHLNRHRGLRHSASFLRSCNVAVAALYGTHSRRHFVLGNTAGLSGLCCRLDDRKRAQSWDGVARHSGESRRRCRTRARRFAVAPGLAF